VRDGGIIGRDGISPEKSLTYAHGRAAVIIRRKRKEKKKKKQQILCEYNDRSK
jgi:hypothetical protein